MSDAHLAQWLTQKREMSADVVNVDQPSQQVVLVRIGDQTFAFPGQAIREILAQPALFFVPGCPSSMEGVIHLRGQIETVIRLHDLLHCSEPSDQASSFFVLMGETAQLRTGIRVEAIIDMIELSPASLQSPPSSLPTQLQPYVSKVLSYEQQPIALLNIEQLFADYAQRLL